MSSETTELYSQAPVVDLRPLLFANLACTMAMIAYVPLIGPIARTLGLAPWQAGATVTVAGLLWLLLARVWGNASDRLGRRAILLFGCAGVAVSYGLLSLFVDLALYWLPISAISFVGLLIGRGAVGAFYAAIPASGQALIADNFPPHARAGTMARMGVANAVGMVFGPALAALLAQYSLSLPLYVMTALPCLAFVLLFLYLPAQEHHLGQRAQPIRLNDPRLRRPLAVAFIGTLSVAVAQITVGFFALDHFALPPATAAQAAGITLTLVGVALILTQLIIARLQWPAQRMVQVGATVAGLGFAGVCLVTQVWHLWLCYFVAAMGMGWVFPAFSALAANAVNADEQGSAAGAVGAAQGLGVVLGPLLGSSVYALAPYWPYLLISLLLLLIAVWPVRTQPKALSIGN